VIALVIHADSPAPEAPADGRGEAGYEAVVPRRVPDEAVAVAARAVRSFARNRSRVLRRFFNATRRRLFI
jgi:hypothetical protein